jgi:hypothetical protein
MDVRQEPGLGRNGHLRLPLFHSLRWTRLRASKIFATALTRLQPSKRPSNRNQSSCGSCEGPGSEDKLSAVMCVVDLQAVGRKKVRELDYLSKLRSLFREATATQGIEAHKAECPYRRASKSVNSEPRERRQTRGRST